MSVKHGHEDYLNLERRARELCGYDEASLLREADEAQRAWEQGKREHPEEAMCIEQGADAGFERLMVRLKAEGARPVTESEYEKCRRDEDAEWPAGWRLRRRAVLIAAAVAVLAIGGSMAVMARPAKKTTVYPMPREQTGIMRYNTALKGEVSDLEAAYALIHEKLGIPVLAFDYMPEGMKFNDVLVEENCVTIEMKYNGRLVRLMEAEFSNANTVSVLTSDREVREDVYNEWINKTIVIEENTLEDGLTEYSANIDVDNVYYFLSGMMEREEFIKMTKNLYYYE